LRDIYMDWTQILLWWVILQLIGWGSLPLAFRVFRWLPGRGYAFSKALGLLLSSYLLWVGATIGLVRNDFGGIFSIILLVFVLSFVVLIWGKERDGSSLLASLRSFIKQKRGMILTSEVLFTLALFGWAILRAYAPYKIMNTGGEKFMEIAFLNATLHSPRFAPFDPWLSGFAISYYYFGYVMMALLTRLSGVAPGVGFDLYDALLFSLTLVGVFGIVYDLIAGRRNPQDQGETVPRNAVSFGVLGALLVAVVGNLEGLLEGLHSLGALPQSFLQWINIPSLAQAAVTGSFYPGTTDGWWWWRASRILSDDPTSNLNSITEFPFFSFLLGDNHPHVLALPFVLLATALAFNLLRWTTANRQAASERSSPWWNPLQTIFAGDWALLLFYGIALGALGFLNTWDMPIYIGLVSLAYGTGLYARRRALDSELVLRTLTLALSLLLLSLGLYIFFYTSFSSQAGGILPFVFPPTRLSQYLVMFGIYLFLVICFLAAFLRSQPAESRQGLVGRLLRTWLFIALLSLGLYLLFLLVAAILPGTRQAVTSALNIPAVQQALGSSSPGFVLVTILIYRVSDPWLFLLLSFLLALVIVSLSALVRSQEIRLPDQIGSNPVENSHIFVLALIFIGLLLTFSVEFFYLRDSFGVRMNTVFKFYYQGWMMLGIAGGYGLWWLLGSERSPLRRVSRGLFTIGAGLLIAAGLVYPVMGYYSRADGFHSIPNLNGASSIAQDNPDDWAAIQWLRQNSGVTPQGIPPTILEAPGSSYTYEGRISAFSGVPALLGWAVHESQWRGSYIEQGKREPDIQTIYTTKDGQLALQLLQKWDVRYVVVGNAETNYIDQKCRDPQLNLACNLSAALRKFDTALKPVFQQGSVTIYAVPETASQGNSNAVSLSPAP
jgi:YYY domain-containing protein